MSDIAIMDDLASWIGGTLVIMLALGGAAAMASGRAIARSWQPFGRAPAYMVLLGLAVGFLHYALLGLPAIPMGAIVDTVTALGDSPGTSLAALASSLVWLVVCVIVLTLFAAAGYYNTRATQMARQYPWLFARRSLFGWTNAPNPPPA